jgi:hypothetical protein
MAARSVTSLSPSAQTVEIFVPDNPLMDRVLAYLAQRDSGLLCDKCAALLRLRDALTAFPKGENRG